MSDDIAARELLLTHSGNSSPRRSANTKESHFAFVSVQMSGGKTGRSSRDDDLIVFTELVPTLA
jgi:hypothetical protein